MKIVSVVAARPNFMKIAPLCRAIERFNASSPVNGRIEHILVHTGQHYDDRMSRAFFDELNIPAADINLGIGSGSHAEQVGNTMIAFEKILREVKPDWVITIGDVNATCACSITAKKEHTKVAHIEAGLRSGDMDMPEEINRLVTDRLSDLLLSPDRLSMENLRKEGRAEKDIVFAGNIMIDTLEDQRSKSAAFDIAEIIEANRIGGGCAASEFHDDGFAVMTLHRPSNVDDRKILTELAEFVDGEGSAVYPVIWAIHPRTRKQLELFGLWEKVKKSPRLALLNPIGYHELLRLNMGAKLMMTDSGGLQEECCVLGTPCLVMRWNTERPVTLRKNGGVSALVGNDVALIKKMYAEYIKLPRCSSRPEFWDGHAADRMLAAIVNYAE